MRAHALTQRTELFEAVFAARHASSSASTWATGGGNFSIPCDTAIWPLWHLRRRKRFANFFTASRVAATNLRTNRPLQTNIHEEIDQQRRRHFAKTLQTTIADTFNRNTRQFIRRQRQPVAHTRSRRAERQWSRRTMHNHRTRFSAPSDDRAPSLARSANAQTVVGGAPSISPTDLPLSRVKRSTLSTKAERAIETSIARPSTIVNRARYPLICCAK